MATLDEPFATAVPGELVVDLEHLPLIERGLSALGLDTGYKVDQENRTLGLALLTGFDGTAGFLDGVLYELRRRFSGKYGGWFPAMGKHRVADLIRPAGPKPMSESLPEPAEPGTIPAAATTVADVKVGVIDTPVYPHRSLPAALVTVCGAPGGPPPEGVLRAGHGTFVTSVIRAAAPAAHIEAKGVLNRPDYTATGWEVAVAIADLAQRVDILNLSFGCFTEDGEAPLVIRRAIERVPAGVTVVAAAGNHGDVVGLVRGRTSRSPAFPAAQSWVLAVGSSGTPAEPGSPALSSFTPDLPWVDRTARGINVLGAFPSELEDGVYTGWATWSGTSFATATVTGKLAAKLGAGESVEDALAQLEHEGVHKFELPQD
ncbi:S8/S53 family peptidase [Amycolatopsis sp. NPDC051758]|uniref:S8/S53 family peptidase n=1 Tax=Amycolatopsis sp. NPDC051758 TaxID=3363935 RepID=UPI003788210C